MLISFGGNPFKERGETSTNHRRKSQDKEEELKQKVVDCEAIEVGLDRRRKEVLARQSKGPPSVEALLVKLEAEEWRKMGVHKSWLSSDEGEAAGESPTTQVLRTLEYLDSNIY